MGWSSDEEPTSKKKGMDTSSKILLAIIICVLLIIILILVLLINIQQTSFSIIVDGVTTTSVTKESMISKIDDAIYVDIENFSKIVGYEYHGGEYKSFTIEEGKCYVQGPEETATFYANDDKVCKLPLNELQEEYREYTVKNTIKVKNNKIYAPIEAINLAFNVVLNVKENSLNIYTLDGLVASYDKKVKSWGYAGISEQKFENKKSILYGYLIVNKEKGLYKIIDSKNSKEIVPDKYKAIEFSENTQEFLVTNSLGQVGIINLDGTTKIEPTYEAITVLDKKEDLYLVQKNKKYGVIKSGNVTVISAEYDSIGLTNIGSNSIIDNKYYILDTLIPVCQNNKWGAFDKNGNLILKLEYDGFGCFDISVEINGIKKTVEPVLTIKRCNGVVLKKDDKYGMVDVTGKELVPIAVSSIYQLEKAEEDSKYYMLYNGNELNIIERLIQAGLIKEKEEKEENSNNSDNDIATSNITTSTTNNTISNQV